ncbi:N-carbamoyl-L-amino-acid hydrolase [Bosea sp. 62]|uniref:Zn-dependent hydrolase n=1 Tax=unclassified Bosea (in: a-proteobacteria) TaxID=2653178 RepID=UPI0012569CFF|nr:MULTISPECIES: Zn-dependent hydrolase [unclassified Bosea (in: a-proteobacteria)]CAD5286269.1 N-carbamoyl-L-amino-acid hydrolase [Bosea sp. 21B]CAD5288876.1 N-carbamoyl-L-amino-acid hydrolase [Bosea sp. 46]CAD5301309.1 N-carbamoyl-L-amino-acid hydrolase [Bosea sp. 7B]VVT60582.1 N-carbamoyl-L-amino-acid hydrolase [Bosea sp. EC-HK365B]VXB05471.1 N-carbamoyl-L-amino-acid hydrolase [Bosea sp. 62]
MGLPATARIDIGRFWTTIERSAEIGVGRPGGLSRLALGDADREVRDVFIAWCREAGLAVRIDGIGNIFARRAGEDDSLPPVVMGSHLDTQVNGGRFDGIAGVLGGLEVCRTLDQLGHRTKRPIEVVNWTNEEGGRFSPPMVGSGCFTGAYTLDWALGRRDDDGRTIGEELDRIGYRGEMEAAPHPFDAYVEFHIEQGPILDREGMQVGVVTGGYASTGMLVEFTGETAHTGPWPMERRKNALIAGARLLVAVDDLGWEHAGSGGKATASRLVAWPNKPGILSDWAQATCDVRHADPETAAVMAERVRRAVYEAAARADCTAEILDIWNWGGKVFADELIEQVRATSQALGYRTRDILSQAGHDAYFVARHAPTTMIFSPCKGGITHNNQELCTPDDLEPGLNVLLHTVVARADR